MNKARLNRLKNLELFKFKKYMRLKVEADKRQRELDWKRAGLEFEAMEKQFNKQMIRKKTWKTLWM